MFSPGCVKNSVKGRACLYGKGHAWQGACVAGGHAWQGACVAGGMHGYGACMAGETATSADGMHPTGMHSSLVVYFC